MTFSRRSRREKRPDAPVRSGAVAPPVSAMRWQSMHCAAEDETMPFEIEDPTTPRVHEARQRAVHLTPEERELVGSPERDEEHERLEAIRPAIEAKHREAAAAWLESSEFVAPDVREELLQRAAR